VNCRRATCAQPVTRCLAKHNTGSCAYYLCAGWVHTGTGAHRCADFEGDAQPEPGTLPTVETPGGEPQGEVA
jgi:hypothetical protein